MRALGAFDLYPVGTDHITWGKLIIDTRSKSDIYDRRAFWREFVFVWERMMFTRVFIFNLFF